MRPFSKTHILSHEFMSQQYSISTKKRLTYRMILQCDSFLCATFATRCDVASFFSLLYIPLGQRNSQYSRESFVQSLFVVQKTLHSESVSLISSAQKYKTARPVRPKFSLLKE